MLNETSHSSQEQGKQATYSEIIEVEVFDDELEVAFEAMQNEISTYQKAGLTHVSTWLE